MCLGIMTVPIINKVILGWVAFGAGFAVAGGFIAFISLIGIVTRLAGLTKTADAIPTYENSLALGMIFTTSASAPARHPANIPVKRPTILIILRAAV